ncbi:hypothetical protein KAFR_0F00970 [Kazachstania africana CBS 2517]|uniref:Spindle pole body-associated protein Vik1/Cik1 microtubule binding domain-containing protein n=1 Tax=Kazachstania africana (strain ATCC 22294 / BCRC 22015 / CBS 2517 / CECT 1963 / NBRC 1671 / NRRL Y-8276) TaxID=1071382 RepID=H2AWE4_KAZAF|nr:hypothetical protein KAFR_0F00970 [Kazachstania africana CBS 2517]CCF58694.1 hypothetical protein KAFR_0F00970 [Kazachstania africana CBS 2517]
MNSNVILTAIANGGTDAHILKKQRILSENKAIKKVSKDSKSRLSNEQVAEISIRKQFERNLIKKGEKLHGVNAETNWNIIRYQTKLIPDLNYAIKKKEYVLSKVISDIRKLDDDILRYEEQIEKHSDKCILDYKRLNAAFDDEIKKSEDQFKELIADLRLQKNKEIDELEKLEPREQLIREIDVLKSNMLKLETKSIKLENSNNKKCSEEEWSLLSSLEGFQQRKNKILDGKRKINEKLKKERMKLARRMEIREKDLSQLTSNIGSLEETVRGLQEQINMLDELSAPKRKKLLEYEDVLAVEQKEKSSLLESAYNYEQSITISQEKLKYERLQRKRLECSIDDFEGPVRTFFYFEPSLAGYNVRADFGDYTITTKGNETYALSRILTSETDTIEDILSQDYKLFHDKCLQTHEDFSFITISTQPWVELRKKFLNFISITYGEIFEIETIQHSVELSNRPDDNPFIDSENSASISSNELRNVGIKKIDESSETPLSGLDIFEINFRSGDDNNIVKEYFFQVQDTATIEGLQKLVSERKPSKQSEYVTFINKLLKSTKSLFIFNVEHSNLQMMLQLSKSLRENNH